MAPKKTEPEIRPHHDWCKMPTSIRESADYYKLPSTQRAAFWDLLSFSVGHSPIPGMFLDSNEEPLSASEIAFQAAKSSDDVTDYQVAIPELRRARLLGFTQAEGFEIARYTDLFCARDEVLKIQKKRDANRIRQRRHRALDVNAPTMLRKAE